MPITLTVRIGTRMSPSAGIVQRLITVFTSRWFMAIMIPLPGTTPTPSIPAMCGDLGRPGARGVDREARLDVELLAGELVAHARAGDGAVVAVQVEHAVVGQDARAVRGRAAGEGPDGLPGVDRRVGHGERALDPGLSRGSRRSASATSISSAGSSAARQPARNSSP